MAHERKGCPDKRATEAMAAAAEAETARVRAGLTDAKALGFRDHEARPLADHLAEWRNGMLAQGMTARHADQYHTRAARLAALTRGVHQDAIDPPGRKPEAQARAARVLAEAMKAARLSDLAPERIQAALGRLRAAGKSSQTVNHYRAALRAFARWCGNNGRLRDNPTRGVKGFNVDAERRHRRRALTREEAVRLIQAAERGPVVQGMTGPDRLYVLTLGTGFRASELASLTPERFDLADGRPTATVPAAYTKNGREAVQPLPTDPTAAGIPYETDSGVADFHRLRGVCVSNLVSSGASVKTCQVLARHSSPILTIGIYAKASLRDIAGSGGRPARPHRPPPGPRIEGRDGDQRPTHKKPPCPSLAHRRGRNRAVWVGSRRLGTGNAR